MGRLISIFLAFGLAAISLSGCQSVQQSAASAAYTCEAAGLRPGTRRFDRCQDASGNHAPGLRYTCAKPPVHLKTKLTLLLFCLHLGFGADCLAASEPTNSRPAEPRGPAIVPGATELSPSRSQYFSWINNRNEGSTEAQTLANLEFFKWLHNEYGMQLDIYAFEPATLMARNTMAARTPTSSRRSSRAASRPSTNSRRALAVALGSGLGRMDLATHRPRNRRTSTC